MSLSIDSSVKLSSILGKNKADDESGPHIGGVFSNGNLGWIGHGSSLEIISLQSGDRISYFDFDIYFRHHQSFPERVVRCACQVTVEDSNAILLVVGIQCVQDNVGLLSFISCKGSRILRTIEIMEEVTSCCFIDSNSCRNTSLHTFNGCIAVGTASGKLLLIDLDNRKCLTELNGNSNCGKARPSPCRVIASDITQEDIEIHHTQSQIDKVDFGLLLDGQLFTDELQQSGAILSVLLLNPLGAVAIGLAEGQLVLFDLITLSPFHIAFPPEREASLVRLTYMEPADDPRACIYIWAFHEAADNLTAPIAVMHSIMFDRKVVTKSGVIYKNFLSCGARLTMPIFHEDTYPISCQNVQRVFTEDETVLSLCQLSWSDSADGKICIFDLNQWYKEQMPDYCDWRESPSFLAILPFSCNSVIDIYMDPVTVTPFSSIDRPEEHFYPNSLSFDCKMFRLSECTKLHSPGLQNCALSFLQNYGHLGITEPSECFDKMIRATLHPHFYDYNQSVHNATKQFKREFLFSIALEHNFIGLLKGCASAWADGSHLGKDREGVALSSLTDWIWSRATVLKDCSNEICNPLFDNSGMLIDLRSQKILNNCIRQLKLLSETLEWIMTICRQYIPENIHETLTSQRRSIQLTFEYLDIVHWLYNMGILPEGEFSRTKDHGNNNVNISIFDDTMSGREPIPYPYHMLNEYYTRLRHKFYEINSNYRDPKTNSCRFLFIDQFLDRECKNVHGIRSEWKHGNGNGLYPPPTLQSLLRTLLIPDITLKNKLIILVYMFCDLNSALIDEKFNTPIQNLTKFPAVFKLSYVTIKLIQAFWYLDHGEFESAVDEFITPILQSNTILNWHREFLIESLLLQNQPELALRVLRVARQCIPPQLAIRCLMTNDRIVEAFELQRDKGDDKLLCEFFNCCKTLNKWTVALDLAYTREETECLKQYLNKLDIDSGRNIHFLYLLQRSKYIEACEFVKSQQSKRFSNIESTTNILLSTYDMTVTPTTKYLSSLYRTMRDDFKKSFENPIQETVPLSSRLLQNKSLSYGNVFQRAVVCSEEATIYWDGKTPKFDGFDEDMIPFLRNPQSNLFLGSTKCDISHPKPFVSSSKRRAQQSIYDREIEEMKTVTKRQRTEETAKLEQYQFSRTRIDGLNNSLLLKFKSKPTSTPMVPYNFQKRAKVNDSGTFIIDTNFSLTTPHVQSVLEQTIRPEPCVTPSSILKIRREEGPIIHESKIDRRSVESDERSIRFNLGNISEEHSMESSDTQSTHVRIEMSYVGATPRPPIHENSSLTASNDDAYSPNNTTNSVEPKAEQHLTTDSSRADRHEKYPEKLKPAIPIEDCRPMTRSQSKSPELAVQSTTASKLKEDSKDHSAFMKQWPEKRKSQFASKFGTAKTKEIKPILSDTEDEEEFIEIIEPEQRSSQKPSTSGVKSPKVIIHPVMMDSSEEDDNDNSLNIIVTEPTEKIFDKSIHDHYRIIELDVNSNLSKETSVEPIIVLPSDNEQTTESDSTIDQEIDVVYGSESKSTVDMDVKSNPDSKPPNLQTINAESIDSSINVSLQSPSSILESSSVDDEVNESLDIAEISRGDSVIEAMVEGELDEYENVHDESTYDDILDEDTIEDEIVKMDKPNDVICVSSSEDEESTEPEFAGQGESSDEENIIVDSDREESVEKHPERVENKLVSESNPLAELKHSLEVDQLIVPRENQEKIDSNDPGIELSISPINEPLDSEPNVYDELDAAQISAIVYDGMDIDEPFNNTENLTKENLDDALLFDQTREPTLVRAAEISAITVDNTMVSDFTDQTIGNINLMDEAVILEEPEVTTEEIAVSTLKEEISVIKADNEELRNENRSVGSDKTPCSMDNQTIDVLSENSVNVLDRGMILEKSEIIDEQIEIRIADQPRMERKKLAKIPESEMNPLDEATIIEISKSSPGKKPEVSEKKLQPIEGADVINAKEFIEGAVKAPDISNDLNESDKSIVSPVSQQLPARIFDEQSSTPKRLTRLRSSSLDFLQTPNRLTRAKSIDSHSKSRVDSPIVRNIRASSVPKFIETSTPKHRNPNQEAFIDSPILPRGPMTRRRSILLGQIAEIGIDEAGPSGISGKERMEELYKTTPVKNTKRSRKTSESEEANETKSDISSVRSTRSKGKGGSIREVKIQKMMIIEEEPNETGPFDSQGQMEYSESRRLTRKQKAMMDKIHEMSKCRVQLSNMLHRSIKESSISSTPGDNIDFSDTDSHISTRSKTSNASKSIGVVTRSQIKDTSPDTPRQTRTHSINSNTSNSSDRTVTRRTRFYSTTEQEERSEDPNSLHIEDTPSEKRRPGRPRKLSTASNSSKQ